MDSTTWYNQNTATLINSYDALDVGQVHEWATRHLREEPGFACDIGAGSGRDANWLAEQGWEVVAVEPSNMRELAQRNTHQRVTWLDDSLPGLKALRELGRKFDLILLSAVWMHVAPATRERAFRILVELLNPAGVLVITLRQGADENENRRRGFHAVSGEELIKYANRRAIAVTERTYHPDLQRSHVNWETLVFAMPDDGTGSLPLLRHIIINDNKSSSYKLGLLRVLARIAETAPGIVIERTDEYVDIPFGMVGLYWIKQYMPLVLHHRLPQLPGRQSPGWASESFHRLSGFSTFDLRPGASFDGERAVIVVGAIREVCANIKKMPARYITYPGAPNRPVFECERKPMRNPSGRITLSREYLAQFGRFRIPAQLWQALGQYACWLEPVIIKEWSRLISGWSVSEAGISQDVFAWHDDRRNTRPAYERAQALRGKGSELTCVWSASRIRGDFAIDHCFPWARWYNNDLWNLLPTKRRINLSKSDKLPSSPAMSEAKGRIIDWWNRAWDSDSSPLRERFFMEAGYSLPGLHDPEPSLDDIYTAAVHQRARLKADQQLVEWHGLTQNYPPVA